MDGMAGDDGPLNIVERELKPGEVSLEDLERAFNEAPGPDDMGPPPLPEQDFSADNEAQTQAEMANLAG